MHCLGTLAYYVVGKLLEYILIRVWTKNWRSARIFASCPPQKVTYFIYILPSNNYIIFKSKAEELVFRCRALIRTYYNF